MGGRGTMLPGAVTGAAPGGRPCCCWGCIGPCCCIGGLGPSGPTGIPGPAMPGGPPGTPAGWELCLLLLWSVLAVLCFFCSFRSFSMTFCMSFVSLVTPSSSAFSLSLSSPLFFFTLRSLEFNDWKAKHAQTFKTAYFTPVFAQVKKFSKLKGFSLKIQIFLLNSREFLSFTKEAAKSLKKSLH